MSKAIESLDNHLCISFGPWCQIHKFFKDCLQSYKNMPNNTFDNTGVSLHTINFLIKNNFQLPTGYQIDRSNISLVEKKSTKEKMYMHNKLFIRYPHHLPSTISFIKNKDITIDDNNFEHFVQSQTRKLERMKQYFSGLPNGYNKNIFIIRFEERKETILKNWEEKLIAPEILENYNKKSDLDNVVEMSDNLRTHFPNVKCKILYVSITHSTKISKEKQIYILNTKELCNYKNSASFFTELIEKEFQKSTVFRDFLKV